MTRTILAAMSKLRSSYTTRREFLKAAGGFVAISALADTVPAAGTAISGKATLVGTPPPEILVDLTDFPEQRKVAPPGLKTQHYVVGPDGGLANVFVYIRDGLAGHPFPPPKEPALLDQFHCSFHPYVFGVRAGQLLNIRNSEPYLETVHALPKHNEEFLLYQPITGEVDQKRFDAPEVLVRIKCELHPWEFAFVGVVDHPFFAVTDLRGEFKIPPGLPPGKYTLAAVHPKAGLHTADITVAENQVQNVAFTFVPHIKPPATTASQ